MRVSVIIRTLNEERYLGELLSAITKQSTRHSVQTVVVDSGSTDKTIKIAKEHEVELISINKENFSFGRSLNFGCDHSDGEILVFISGHCVPCDEYWLDALIKPIIDGRACYTYGRQTGRDGTCFSEQQVFQKLFPVTDNHKRLAYFCNNANAAVDRKIWQRFRFDESITGLEDLEMAKRCVAAKENVAYVREAAVFHMHNETAVQIYHRYSREAMALQKFAPELYLPLFTAIRCFIVAVCNDIMEAIRARVFIKSCKSIFCFRAMQYLGSYQGGRPARKINEDQKLNYYYPKDTKSW